MQLRSVHVASRVTFTLNPGVDPSMRAGWARRCEQETPVASQVGPVRRADSSESVAGRLLDLLVVTSELGAVLGEITDLAVETIPGCVSASITVIHQGTPETAASADSRARAVDEGQYRDGQGPCLEAARSGRPVRVDDIADAEPDFRWRSIARDAHITASLSMPILSSTNIDAALNLYTDHDGGWPELAYDAAELVADHAADAITIAYRMTHRHPDVMHWPYTD
jgi:GAF domain-containing protein